jgi:cell division initiation protein
MAITAKIIEEKEFSRLSNGYNPDEVDDFLDEILDYMDAREAEMNDLRARLANAQAAANRPSPMPQSDLEGASVLLKNAQAVYDQTVRDAQGQAQEMISAAHAQAEQIVADAKEEIKSLTEQLQTMRSAALDYRARFLRLVEDQQHVLSAENELFKKG